MNMVVHNLVRRDARKRLEILDSDDRMGPPQGKANIVLNARLMGAHLLLPFHQSPLPLWTRSKFFQQSHGRGRLRGLRDGSSWSDRSPFSMT